MRACHLRLEVGVFAVLDDQKSHIFHVRSIVMDKKARRDFSRIEVLMPTKDRNTQRVAFLPFVPLILDEGVPFTC